MVDIKLCFGMALHNRLGQNSSIHQISQDCMRKIVEFFFEQIVNEMSINSYIQHQFSIILSNIMHYSLKNLPRIDDYLLMGGKLRKRPSSQIFSSMTEFRKCTKKTWLLMRIINSVHLADDVYWEHELLRPTDCEEKYPEFTKKIPKHDNDYIMSTLNGDSALGEPVCGFMSLFTFKDLLSVSYLYNKYAGSFDTKHKKRIEFIKQKIGGLNEVKRKQILSAQLSHLGNYKYWKRFNRPTSENNVGLCFSHRKGEFSYHSCWDNGKNVKNEEEEDDLFFC